MEPIKIPKNIFTKKTQDYTFAVLFFIIFSVFIVFAIKPSLTTAASLKKEESDLERIDNLYESKIVDIASIQSQLEENRDNLPLLTQAISNFPQVNKTIEDIKAVADQNSFTIKRASIADVNLFESNKKNLKQLRVTVEGNADFKSVMQFITALYNQRRLKTVPKLSISRDESSTTSAQLKISLDIEAYYL